GGSPAGTTKATRRGRGVTEGRVQTLPFSCLFARSRILNMEALIWAQLVDEARLVPSRQPIFNVPPVVVAVLTALVVVHAGRLWLLSDDLDRVVVWTLACVPARYESSALTDGLLPGGWGADVWTFVTYALIHADLTH